MTVILAALASAWAFVLPWAGPILARLAPQLVTARKATSRAVPALLVLAIAGVALWVLANALLPAADQPRTVLVSEVEKQRWEARAKSLADAQRQTEETLAWRTEALGRIEDDNDRLRQDLEKLRAQTRDPNGVVLPADDPWLRAWQNRAAARQAGRAGRR